MASVNKVTLIGRVGKDPEIKEFGSGAKNAKFSLATEKYTKDGKEPVWHSIVVWNKHLIEKVIEPYLTKGAMIYVVGELEYGKFVNQNGVEQKTTDVTLGYESTLVILSSKQLSEAERLARGNDHDGSYANNNKENDLLVDDEIPF